MFVNTMPRYEILSADAIEVLDRGWRRIVSENGGVEADSRGRCPPSLPTPQRNGPPCD